LVYGVSFADFAALAKRKLWTVEHLATKFRGAIEKETSSSFFYRVLHGDPAWDIAIPYRAIIEAYLTAASELIADKRIRVGACGCGSPVFGARLVARDECGPPRATQQARGAQLFAQGMSVREVAGELGISKSSAQRLSEKAAS